MEIAAKQKVYGMKQSWRQASMQVSNSSVARPWKLEQNTSGQASRQALSQASREGLKAIEIGANWPPTVRAMGILVGHSSATLFFDN